jgi:predicted  nucleic acid-binding Zn-ribbon protein
MIRRLSHEEYIQKMLVQHPTITVREQHQGHDIPILYECQTCRHTWKKTPDQVFRGCPRCKRLAGGHKAGRTKAKTHEVFEREINELHPTIEIVDGNYYNNSTKLSFYCKVCGHKWHTTPAIILNGKGCPECTKVRRTNEQRKTQAEFEKQIQDLFDGNIIVIGQYIQDSERIGVRCKIDGYIWFPVASSLVQQNGCPKCRDERLRQERKKTTAQFRQEIAILHPGYKVLGEYGNNNCERVLMECPLGHQFMGHPGNLLQGQGCPVCREINLSTCLLTPLKYSPEEYIDVVKQISGGNIIPLEEYRGMDRKIRHLCKKCNREWSVIPYRILNNSGCPRCKESRGEKVIANILDNYHVQYIAQKAFEKCKYKKQLRFDFYLPDYNVAIEYQGEQHYRPVNFNGLPEERAKYIFEQVKIRDQVKRDFCDTHHIQLIAIPYWDFGNIEDWLKPIITKRNK